jgi:peptidyl-prolyl cis-trans isomerase B (cyclophilin B)
VTPSPTIGGMRSRPGSRPHAALALPVVLLLALLGLVACSGDEPDTTATDEGTSESPTESPAGGPTVPCTYPDQPAGKAGNVDPPPSEAPSSGTVDVTMATSVGDLHATLDQKATPCTVNSFVSLAQQGYFDGTQCHRLTTEGIFVLQCGDPTGTGGGGPGYSFDDELTGKETYPAGTLAMANAGPNTNGSQFFIVYADTQLPPSYAVFGTVDDASVKVVADVAKQGSNEQNGPGDGAPNEKVEFDSVTVG